MLNRRRSRTPSSLTLAMVCPALLSLHFSLNNETNPKPAEILAFSAAC